MVRPKARKEGDPRFVHPVVTRRDNPAFCVTTRFLSPNAPVFRLYLVAGICGRQRCKARRELGRRIQLPDRRPFTSRVASQTHRFLALLHGGYKMQKQINAVSLIAPLRGNSRAVRPNQDNVAGRPTLTHKGVQDPAVPPLRGSSTVEARSARPTPNTNAKSGTGNLPVEQRDKTLTKKPVTGVALSQRQNQQTGSSGTLRHHAADALRSNGQSKQSSVVAKVHKKVPTASALGESLAASSRKPEQAVKTATAHGGS